MAQRVCRAHDAASQFGVAPVWFVGCKTGEQPLGVFGGAALDEAPDDTSIGMRHSALPLRVVQVRLIVPALSPKLPYDPARDFTPVALLANTPLVLLVNPAVPASTPAEFVAYAKTQPKGLSYGSSGIGSSIHFAGSLFAMATGAPLVHVPYQGSAGSITDVLGGNIPAIFLDVGAGAGLVAVGKVRAIGVTSAQRSAALPQVPSLSEVAPGFSIGAWYGLYGPAGMPKQITEVLNMHAVRAVNSPEHADVMVKRGNEPGKLDAPKFADYLRDELQKWSRIAKEANIKAE